MLLQFKRKILASPAGGLVTDLRSRLELIRASFGDAADLGTAANDYLAAVLTVRICAPHKTFIDVGAHLGSVLSNVMRQVPSARIIAVEGVPDKARFLKQAYPDVEVHSCALGAEDGQVAFYIDTERSGFSSLDPTRSGRSTRIDVQMKRLDQIVQGADVDTIKIDVEGAELDVLVGGTALLDRCRPLIMFESGTPRDADLPDRLWKFFDARDYLILVPDRLAHLGPGLTIEGFEESHHYPRRTTNYFSVPKERRDEFRERARTILSV
jgi:FkbM family methyltransferase